jgi:tetratricopeptide (TPR) repeat protein
MHRRLCSLTLIAGAASCSVATSLPAAGPARPAAVQSATPTTRLAEHFRADILRRLDYATSLAERGAALSARSETIDALKLIARCLDSGSAAGPRTRILEVALKDIFDKTPAVAESVDQSRQRQERYQAASTQLERAFAGEPLASRGLYTLGRLQLLPGAAVGEDSQFSKARAMALFLAAVGVDQNNSAATHELGTMFASFGRLETAAHWLELSTRGTPHPESLENLAAVYDKLGQAPKAEAARLQAQQLAAANCNVGSATGITWVDQSTFASTTNSDPSAVPRGIELIKAEAPAAKPVVAPEDSDSGWKWPSFRGRNRK